MERKGQRLPAVARGMAEPLQCQCRVHAGLAMSATCKTLVQHTS